MRGKEGSERYHIESEGNKKEAILQTYESHDREI